MQAQEALNKDALVDGHDSEVGDDLNDSDVDNQAPINHIDDYMEDTRWTKTKSLMMNFWTKITSVGRTHIRCFQSRVLRNTRQILLVNFIRVEARRGLTLFV